MTIDGMYRPEGCVGVLPDAVRQRE